ncbi:MAG: DUF190 domain-containing protein [Roseiflexaceae bacterium]|nr:DUF190 domain-containing protein [Roseiflexaceae bacterium]
MQVTDTVQRVRIYLSEGDEVSGRPLYLATLELLREAGATGATALRGIAGFGSSQRLHVAATGSSGDAPIVIEWIDRGERVARVLPTLDAMLPTTLITVEAVQVYRAILRSGGPFGDRSVRDLIVGTVFSLAVESTLSEATRQLISSDFDLLPVVDAQGRLAGTLRDSDLRRYGLPALADLRSEGEEQRALLLAPFALTPLTSAITSEALALSADASVLQAANTMVEWGIDELPIVERDGQFAGLFTLDLVLDAALAVRSADNGRIRTADAPTPLSTLMQAPRPTILGYELAADALVQLVGARTHIFVLDNGRPLGVLDRATLLANITPLRALLAGEPTREQLQAVLGEQRVASLPLAPLPALDQHAGYDQAIITLREHNASWLAAVDEQGKTQGLVGKRTLLRALVQESAH